MAKCSACDGSTECETCGGSGWRAEGTMQQNKWLFTEGSGAKGGI